MGEKREYFVLRLSYGDLTLLVPLDNTEEVGIRDVIGRDELEKVFKVLRSKECRMPTNWSRRFKTHVEKLRSGDIYQVAEVVRNLARRDKEKGLSAGERVLDHSLAALGDAPSIGSIVVVVPEALRTVLEGDLLAVSKVVAVLAGGQSRQESLVLGLAGVARVAAAAGVIAVHDAARP